MQKQLLITLLYNSYLVLAQNAASSAAPTAQPSSAATDAPTPEEIAFANMTQTFVSTHASVMSLAFLFFFPIGAIVMRVGAGPRTVWIHAALQVFAWLLTLVGMGLGIWLAITGDLLDVSIYHPIIGMVVVSLLAFQAPVGFLHHWFYKRNGKRTIVGYLHMWSGRALLVLGAINGGLGTQLSADSIPGTIAYGTLAGIIYVSYFVLIAVTMGRRKRITEKDNHPEVVEHNEK